MANYNRDILVPYLQDICCVEIMCRKLEQDIPRYRAEANKYLQWANSEYKDPPQPYVEDVSAYKREARKGILFACALIVVGILLLGTVIFGIPLIVWGIRLIKECKSDLDEIDDKVYSAFDEKMEWYKKQVAQNKKYRASIPEWRAAAQKYQEQEQWAENKLREAKEIREKLYSANIIPSRYRNIQAVYYLYDFFNTSRETDLEKTIQTMLLDEIIQKMDMLIAQNREILLNQRMQIAMQQENNRVLANNHRENMKQIARMERNQERQMDYMHMIACNQEVTNFFLAADYIERHR